MNSEPDSEPLATPTGQREDLGLEPSGPASWHRPGGRPESGTAIEPNLDDRPLVEGASLRQGTRGGVAEVAGRNDAANPINGSIKTVMGYRVSSNLEIVDGEHDRPVEHEDSVARDAPHPPAGARELDDASGVVGTGGSGDTPGATELDPPETAHDNSPGGASLVRLQKVLAAAGVGSRRACEQLIAAGRVSVDGQVVDQLGARVDPDTAQVSVDGRRVSVRPGLVHLVLNKPKGVLSAMSDDRGRPTVGDLVRDRPERLFHVGRLDADSEGLLLLTNDGPLAHGLMHPSLGVPKTYLVEVDGSVSRDVTRRLLSGVDLVDGFTRVDSARVVERLGERTLVEVVLHEGRNRIVRRLLDEVGHPVRRLVRTAIGTLQLGGLRPGTLRELSQDEVSSLYVYLDKTTKQ